MSVIHITKKQLRFLVCFCALFYCINLQANTQAQADKLFSASLVEINQGKWNAAEDTLLELLRLRPYDPVVLNNLAWVYFQKKQPEQGRQLLFTAMQTNPVYQAIYTNIKNLTNYEASAEYNVLLNNPQQARGPNIRLLRDSAPDSLLASNTQERSNALALNSEVNRLIQANKARKRAEEEKRLRAAAEAKRKREEEARKREEIARKKREEAKRKREEIANQQREEEVRLTAEQERTRQAKASQQTQQAQQRPSDVAITDLRSALRNWAVAWSAGNVEAYFGFYAADFTPAKLSLAKWKRQRRARIYPARNIRVTYRNTVVRFVNKSNTLATTRFTQTYKANNYKSVNKKQLTWRRTNAGDWKIVKEVSLP